MRGVAITIHFLHTLFIDFRVPPMREFDAIFGMDWMLRHMMLIDCQKKKAHHHLKWKVKLAFKDQDKDIDLVII